MDKIQALEVLRERLRVSHSRLDPERVTIGDFTYGQPLILTWGENTKLTIGKFCSIGANVQIYLGGNHHTDWLTTYPFNVLLKDQYLRGGYIMKDNCLLVLNTKHSKSTDEK